MFRQSLRLIKRQSEWFVRELKPKNLGFFSNSYFVAPEKRVSPFIHLEKINCFYLSSRSYSKNRDKRKEKKKVLKFDEHELNEYFDVETLMLDIKKPLEIFREELVKHATLRSSTGAIEKLKVQYEGGVYTIQDLAQVGKKNPRLIVLDFSAFPKAVPAVLTAFQKSELNINAQQDGTKVFVPLPKVTKDHREVLVKKCKLYFVKCKEAIRDVQMKYIRKLGNIQKLSVEEKFRLTDQLTALGNSQIDAAEVIMKDKQEELMAIEDLS